jgi:hypothetical protein
MKPGTGSLLTTIAMIVVFVAVLLALSSYENGTKYRASTEPLSQPLTKLTDNHKVENSAPAAVSSADQAQRTDPKSNNQVLQDEYRCIESVDLDFNCDEMEFLRAASDEDARWMHANLFPSKADWESIALLSKEDIVDLERRAHNGDPMAAIILSLYHKEFGELNDAALWSGKATRLAPDSVFPWRLQASLQREQGKGLMDDFVSKLASYNSDSDQIPIIGSQDLAQLTSSYTIYAGSLQIASMLGDNEAASLLLGFLNDPTLYEAGINMPLLGLNASRFAYATLLQLNFGCADILCFQSPVPLRPGPPSNP